jgi:hypothetical protein
LLAAYRHIQAAAAAQAHCYTTLIQISTSTMQASQTSMPTVQHLKEGIPGWKPSYATKQV